MGCLVDNSPVVASHCTCSLDSLLAVRVANFMSGLGGFPSALIAGAMLSQLNRRPFLFGYESIVTYNYGTYYKELTVRATRAHDSVSIPARNYAGLASGLSLVGWLQP